MRQTHVGVSRATAGPYFRHHGQVPATAPPPSHKRLRSRNSLSRRWTNGSRAQHWRRFGGVVVLLASVSAGCSGGTQHGIVRQAGVATTSSSSSTTTATTVPATAAVTVAPRPGCPPVPARLGPAPDRPQYALTVHVDLP